MKKNQLLVIVSTCLLLSCWKTNVPEDYVYNPESLIRFKLGAGDYIFSGNEVKTYHVPGDSLYRFMCETNKMRFEFEFKCSGFDKDSLLILNGRDFRFWESYYEYQAGNFGFIIHCQKRDGNLFSGYFTGYVNNHALMSATALNGHFDLLFFK